MIKEVRNNEDFNKQLTAELKNQIVEGALSQVHEKNMQQLEKNTKEAASAKKENEIKLQIREILSEKVLENYLAQFDNLSKGDVIKKRQFFDRSISAMTQKIVKVNEKEKKDIDIKQYVLELLSKGSIYSKINKAVSSDKKNTNKEVNNMKFETPQNNKQENNAKESQGKKVEESAVDVLNSASTEELANILKQKDASNIDKNLSEISEELEDLKKRTSNMESTMKSPTKVIGDKGATTQEDVNKLLKQKESLIKNEDKLKAQKKMMRKRKVIEELVRENASIDVESKEKELGEMRDEIAKMNERIASGKNYESKQSYSAGDIVVDKDVELVKKVKSLESDVKRLEVLVEQGKKAKEILEKTGEKIDEVSETKKEGEQEKIIKEEQKDGVLDAMSEEDIKKFDKDFVEGAAKKQFENISTENLQQQVLDLWEVRSELLGKDGITEEEFQVNQKKIDIIKSVLIDRGEESRATVLSTMNIIGDEKMERLVEEELADQFERETGKKNEEDAREAGELGELELADKFERERAEKLEQLTAALEDARTMFSKKNYDNNNAWAHVKKVLGLKLQDRLDPDMQVMKDNYHVALKEYKDVLLADAQKLSPEDRIKFVENMVVFNAEEKAQLVDGYTQAHAEKLEGQPFAGKLKNMGKWFATGKTGKALRGGAMVVGLASGSVRMLLSQAPKFAMKFGAGETTVAGLEKIAFASKFLMPIGLGVAVGSLTESRLKARFEKKEAKEVQAFEDMTQEEKMLAVMDVGQESFDKMIKTMGTQINRRRISVTAGGMAAVAAFAMTGSMDFSDAQEQLEQKGDLYKGNLDASGNPIDTVDTGGEGYVQAEYGDTVFDSYAEAFNEEMKGTRAFERFKLNYGPDAHQEFLDKPLNLTVNGERIEDTLENKEEHWNKKVGRAERMYESMARTEVMTNTAHDLAKQMGIDSVDKFNFTAEGNVPTVINNVPVPEHLFSDEQRQSIANVRAIRNWTPDINSGDVSSEPTIHHTDNTNKIYQSKDVGVDIPGYLESKPTENMIRAAAGGVNEGPGTDWVEREEDDYIKSEAKKDDAYWAETEKNEKIAHELAKKMGIDNSDSIKFSNDFSEINGQSVPEELLTEEQKSLTEANRAMNEDNVVGDNFENIVKGVITSEQIEAAKNLPETERDVMENYLIKLNNGSYIGEQTVQEVLQDTTPEEVAKTIGENDVQKVVTEITEKYEVPDDWDSHEAHNFYDKASRDAALGNMEQLTDTEVVEQHDIYKLFTNAVQNVEQQKIEMDQWQVEHSSGNVDVYKSFENAVKAAEDQKAEFVLWQEAHAGSNVNMELLEKGLKEAMGSYEINVNIPEMPESVDAVDMNAAMEQMDNSAEMDNPMSQGFSGIEMGENDKGVLEIVKGDSVKSRLAEFLKDNSTRLTEGGMGWDPQDSRWENVEEWANDRAVGLAAEIAKANPGVDIGFVESGTKLNLDLSDRGDVKVDIDFEGKKHIIPENEKIKFDVGNAQEPEPQINEMENQTSNSGIENTVVGESEVESPNPLENTNEVQVETEPVSNSEVEENIVTQGAEPITENQEKFENMSEIEVIRELMGNPDFNNAAGKQIQEVFGVSSLANIKNIANVPLAEYLEENYTDKDMQTRLTDVISRAKESFGDTVGEPQKETTVSKYFTRMFAQAVKEGKVKDVFPSSDFSL